MTIAVMKTKAELALAEQFHGALPALPGGAETARTRRGAFATFGELGLPGRFLMTNGSPIVYHGGAACEMLAPRSPIISPGIRS